MDIQRAIKARLTTFIFEGTEMNLKWTAWCSITMNPGYAGEPPSPSPSPSPSPLLACCLGAAVRVHHKTYLRSARRDDG